MKINGINNLDNINKSNPIKNDINIDLNKKNINEINNSNLVFICLKMDNAQMR